MENNTEQRPPKPRGRNVVWFYGRWVDRPEHRPGPDQCCVCGAQEVFFEGYALDPGDLGPVVGYGCDAEGHPFVDELDRLGFHINKRAVADRLSDEQWDRLMDDPRWETLNEASFFK